eukprot:2296981-Pyramimonas_sp.AAC.1
MLGLEVGVQTWKMLGVSAWRSTFNARCWTLKVNMFLWRRLEVDSRKWRSKVGCLIWMSEC